MYRLIPWNHGKIITSYALMWGRKKILPLVAWLCFTTHARFFVTHIISTTHIPWQGRFSVLILQIGNHAERGKKLAGQYQSWGLSDTHHSTELEWLPERFNKTEWEKMMEPLLVRWWQQRPVAQNHPSPFFPGGLQWRRKQVNTFCYFLI